MTSKKDKIVALFQKYDHSGEGVMERPSLERLLYILDPVVWNSKSLPSLMDAIDTSQDGRIRVADFITWALLGFPSAGPVDITSVTRMATDDLGLLTQPADPMFKTALVQVFVRSQTFGGTDKSSNGHRYDSAAIANGMIAAGLSCQLVHYIHEEHDRFFELMEKFDAVIVRCASGQVDADGGCQKKFDDGLRALRDGGIQVWPSPDAVNALAAGDALAKIAHLSIGLEDTMAYYTPGEFAEGFRKSVAFQPRVIKQGHGSSGEGVWNVRLKAGNYCANYGERTCGDEEVLELTEASSSLYQQHTVAEFIEFCMHGRTAQSGQWTTRSAGKYFESARGGGGYLVDQRYCPRIVHGVLRYNMVGARCVGIIHRQSIPGGITASGGMDSVCSLYSPEEARFAGLSKAFLEADVPMLMPAMNLSGEPLPLWWTADFVCSSPPGTAPDEEAWIANGFDCSCVGVSQCIAACCKDRVYDASYEDIPEEDRREAARCGDCMGQFALAVLTEAQDLPSDGPGACTAAGDLDSQAADGGFSTQAAAAADMGDE